MIKKDFGKLPAGQQESGDGVGGRGNGKNPGDGGRDCKDTTKPPGKEVIFFFLESFCR